MYGIEQKKILQKNSVFVCPTDTLYGVCASAFSKKAVERIYIIKGRDDNKPFIVLISSIADLKKFSITLTRDQKNFLSIYWPGSVSVVLPVPLKKFEYLHRGVQSVVFRLPNKKLVQQLLKKTGPLVAPSANPQGLKPAETITEAKKYFGQKIDFYIAGGRLTGKPSTIVSLLNKKPTVLRQGSVRIKLDDK